MKGTNRLVVSAPGVSKALLMDLLGGLAMQDQRIKVAEERLDSNLNVDPATVALITSGGLALVELIKSVTQIYLARKKAQSSDKSPPPEVRVTVHLALGEKRSGTVSDSEQIGTVLANLPNDYAEVSRVQIT